MLSALIRNDTEGKSLIIKLGSLHKRSILVYSFKQKVSSTYKYETCL